MQDPESASVVSLCVHGSWSSLIRIVVPEHFALTEASYAVVRLVQHFTSVTNCDPEPWKECLGVTYNSDNGVKVGLIADDSAGVE